MLVKNIMTTPVRTVTPATQLVEVVSMMTLYRLSGLPVVDNGMLVGIIAERDVLHRMFPTLEDLMDSISGIDYDAMIESYKDVVNLKVADLMTPGPVTVTPDMHVLKAAAIMAGRKFRRIPVADKGKLVGVLSLGDVHKAIFHANVSRMLSVA